MKRSFLKNLLPVAILAIGSFTTQPASAQTKFHAQTISTSVKGTSTLHDWEMKSSQGNVNAAINVESNNIDFTGLSFSLPAESLKSGHGMMDKNTYKALNTGKNPNISFVLSTANVTPSGANTYQVKGTGNLTIAGTTKKTDVIATVKYDPAQKSFTCVGTKTFKMSEYGVKPPTVMMGTIKTGDQITISYNLTLKS